MLDHLLRPSADPSKTEAMKTAPLVLRAGPCSVAVDLASGGRLSSWQIHGQEVLEQRSPGNHPFGWGSYAMVPWAGRLRNGQFTFDNVEYTMAPTMDRHAIHGTTYDVPWTHLTGSDDWAMIGMRLEDPWPFGGSVTHLIHLGTDSLTQTLTVVAGNQPMPATVGWHPWFRRQLDFGGPLHLAVDMSRAGMLVRDGAYIPSGDVVPVGPRPWDDCFECVGSIALRWDGFARIDVAHECENVVMYDPPHAICVEPQSGPPDSFNLVAQQCRLEAGEVLERTVTWRWTMASQTHT